MFRLGRPRSRIADDCRRSLAGSAALEAGGPSRIFSRKGRLPVYDVLASLAACDFGTETAWSQADEAPGRYRRAGLCGPVRCLEQEAAVLGDVADASFGAVLASHVLEHLANPLKALAAWRRVATADARLVLVLPHRDGTFDHRRPVTSLAHLVDDLASDVGEDDLTHLEEVLALHDLARDPGAGTRDEFERRSRDNARQRCLHHHVFDTELAIRLLDRAGYGVEAVDAMRPYHVILLANLAGGGNEAWLAGDASWRKTSPFASDL